jgi:endonuclease YncB( thermonuclease family)
VNTACAFAVCLLVGAAHVHDGDTMRVDGYSVRLQGVDAEELTEPNGPAARDALKEIVRGVEVSCQVVGKSYNRAVAYCVTETGVDVNAEIIRRGFALDCGRYSRGKFRRLEPAGARSRLLQKPYC